MVEHWITLTNLPTTGREFSFDDPALWVTLWRSFQYDVTAVEPLASTMTIQPQAGGFFVQGRLHGVVETQCHRCAERALAHIDHAFDRFEALDDVNDPEGEGSHLRQTDTGWELNVAGLLWEEFLLAMPEKILCADTCLGLCPHCGKNRNLEPCTCATTESQNPLARALQGVAIKTT